MDVRMPDGTIVTNVPDDVTQTELLRRFNLSKQPVQPAQPELPVETTFGGHAKEFVKGLGAGAVNLAETAGTGFSALLSDKLEKQGREAMKEGLAGVKESLKAEKGYEDTVSRKLGEGLGSTLPLFAAAPLGIPGVAAGFATSAASGAGEQRQRAESEGATESERRWATVLGIGPGLLDFVAPELKIGKTIITRALMKGGVEGATEAAQQVAQNLIAKGVYSPDSPIFEGSGEAGAYGAGVGAIASTLVDLALGRRARGVKTPKEEKPKEEGTGVMPAGPTAPGAELQGQLFTENTAPATPAPQRFTEQDNTRLEELAAKPNLTGEEHQEFVYLMVAKDAAKPATVGETQAKPETAVQPDMVQEAEAKQAEELYAQDAARDAEETKQIEDMYAQDEREPVVPGEDIRADTAALEALVPAKGERQARQEQQKVATAERKLRAEEQKLADLEATMAADVAATDDRVAKAQELKSKPTPPGQMSFPGMGEPAAPTDALSTPIRMFRATKPGYKSGNTVKDGVYMTITEQDAWAFAGEGGTVTPVETTPKAAMAGEAPVPVQGEMFGPRGGVLKEAIPPTAKQVEQRKAEYAAKQEAEKQARSERAKKAVETRKAKQEAESAVTRAEPTAARVSPESTVGERGERRAAVPSAERTEASKAPRLGDTKRVPVQPTGRAGKQQPAVKETKAQREAREAALERNKAVDDKFDTGLSLDALVARTSTAPTLAELIAAKKKGAKKLEGAAALALDLDEATTKLIKDGDISGALNRIAETTDGIASRIAKALAPLVSNVKIGIVSAAEMNKHSLDGGVVNGMYFPKQNAILLNADTLNPHTILHEAVHAATSHVLENTSHPVTKQLQKLFDDVKGSLDTAYGAQSLDEFVAEAFSNPEFQAKLNAINPKGEPVTAWQRFTNTIKNFLRRMVGMDATGLTSMDKADALISAILSPSPETRDAGSLYHAAVLGRGMEWMDDVIKGRSELPLLNPDNWHEFFTGTAPKAAKKALMGALPGHAFVDVAKGTIPMAETYKTLIESQSKEDHKAAEKLNESIKDVNRWYRNQTREVRAAFNRIGPDSSRLQVDPSKPRSAYANKKDKDGNDLGKAWDSLNKDWKLINAEGHKLYEMQRDTYARQRDKIQELLGARIDEAVSDPETATALKNEMYKRLSERGGIDPYFPLHREGDYWVSFMGKDPRFGNDEHIVRAFTTKRARDRFLEEHKDEIKDVQEYNNFRASNFKGLPPTSFASSVVKTLEANKVDTETIDQIMRLYIDTLPESSFAQAFRTRKGTLGYEGSAVDTFRKKALSTERQMTNMKYGAQYAKLIADTEEHIKKTGSKPIAIELGDELIARIKLAASPQVPKWAKIATSLNFNMFMGLNISSAVINMSQIPLVVAPYLGGKFGMSETTKAIGRATKIVMNSGKEREIEDYLSTAKNPIKRKVKSYLSIDNYDFSKQPELKHLETLTRVAEDRGQLNHSQMYDALDMDSTDTVLGRVNAVTGFVFHHGERINRQVSMVAAYELHLQKIVGKGKPLSSATEAQRIEAANEAIDDTEMTNGDTAAAAAPRLAQGASGIGKVMFLFKRYGASMYYMLFKTAKQALSMKKPEGITEEEWKATRKQAMKQIVGIYGSAGLLAGVKGMPLFGMLALIWNLFRDDDEDDAGTLVTKFFGDTAYKGPLNALTGMEISGRIGLSDLIFRESNYANKDMTPIQSLFELMGGPVLSIGNKMFRGAELIGEGHVERGLEQMVPTAMGNLMKATRFGAEGAQTLRGDPITGEMNPANVAAQAFGFAPADYIKQMEINANTKRIDRASNEKRTKIMRQFYMAIREGDSSGMQDAMDDIYKFNAKHPGNAITPDSIKNSIAQHMKTSATMYHGITLSKGMRPELMSNIAEYDNGIDLFD